MLNIQAEFYFFGKCETLVISANSCVNGNKFKNYELTHDLDLTMCKIELRYFYITHVYDV